LRVVDGLLMKLYSTTVASWYLALRTRLTLAASLCLVIAAIGAFPR
jgi:hypothetical protein